jgi:hypothetical protein
MGSKQGDDFLLSVFFDPVPLKRLIFNGLHGVTSQKIELFTERLVFQDRIYVTSVVRLSDSMVCTELLP